VWSSDVCSSDLDPETSKKVNSTVRGSEARLGKTENMWEQELLGARLPPLSVTRRESVCVRCENKDDATDLCGQGGYPEGGCVVTVADDNLEAAATDDRPQARVDQTEKA